MKLLLDTHIFLWSLLDPKNLAREVAADIIRIRQIGS